MFFFFSTNKFPCCLDLRGPFNVVLTPSNVPLFMNVPPAGEGEEEWQKELVNGSQNYMLKGLKEGLSYRVRLVAKGHSDQTPHRSEELLVTVPGEAVRGRPPLPWPGMAWLCTVSCVDYKVVCAVM